MDACLRGRAASEQARRANKPLMEKRRRARINRSLAQLRTILLNSHSHAHTETETRTQTRTRTRNKAHKHKQSKLEKADILEMTVRHFQMTNVIGKNDIEKYRAGYNDCAKEVERFLSSPDIQTATFPDLSDFNYRLKLLKHLENCIFEIRPNEINKVEEPALPLFFNDIVSSENEQSAVNLSHQLNSGILRNIIKKNVSEKENLLSYCKELKQECISLSDAGNDETNSNQECVREPDPDNKILSVLPTGRREIVFFFHNDCDYTVGLPNCPQYFYPFLSSLSKNVSMCDAQASDSESETGIARVDWGTMNNDNSMGMSMTNHEHDSDEPLDFSMSMRSSDPMWRPW